MGAAAAVPRDLASASASTVEIASRLTRLALPWVENTGQWDTQAAWRAQSFAGSVWLMRDGAIVHEFIGPHSAACARAEHLRGPQIGRQASPCPRARGWMLAERFVGGQVGHVEGREPLEGRVSYFVGEASRHVADLPTFGALDLGEVFPGVRVELRATQANVEKLFTVAPGRDPGVIRMRLEGTPTLRLTAEGALEAMTDHGPVRFTPPVAFQFDAKNERREVPVRYLLAARACGRHCHEYGFALGPYDRSRPVTIDPLLQSTYLGGGGTDVAYAVAIHPITGEVYVTGYTEGSSFLGVTGGAFSTHGGLNDVFVSRFNASLTSILQSTYYGGSGSDRGHAIAIHPGSGDVYVTGTTTSLNLPGTTGGAQPSHAAGGADTDSFVARFNGSLTTLIQATYLGGPGGADVAYGLAIHPETGQVYVAGATESGAFPAAAGGGQPTKNGVGYDAFVARLNAALTNILQSTYLGGHNAADGARGIAIHPMSGEVYVTGTSNASDFPMRACGAQPNNASTSYGDGFVSRLRADLTAILQSTYLGGDHEDVPTQIAIHPADGAVYVAGYTQSSTTTFPGITGGAVPTRFAAIDGFVSRLNPTLTALLQSTFIGGDGHDHVYALSIHPVSGEIYVAGRTESTNLVGSSGGIQATRSGTVDAFVARFDRRLLSLRQSTYLGGGGSEEAYGLAIHPLSGEVYVAGMTNSSSPNPFPGTSGGAQPNPVWVTEGFAARMSLDLAAADVVPDAFVLPAQYGVPVSSLRTAGPVQVTGITASALVAVDGAPGSAVCISNSPTCTCATWSVSGTIANNEYLCVRHVSAPTTMTHAESRVVVGGHAAKFVTFTSTPSVTCSFDLDDDGLVVLTKEGLLLVRSMLGFPPAEAVVGTGITQAQWEAKRAALRACGMLP
ncbi:MAG: hypothetical protein NZ533_07310 [Casimicrobiaceae bacterium]|nr:hypothetical protein [Casimicrobiaceae bacterium]